ncbi:hypothetical protein RDI58_013865 [Solanum bulbocastanum]|uniref:Uncharacterized protein n=1 Tax=Solanum bulbocastanum TaxID=147425 RepID=A0AAN8TMZ1_SOLBU
MLKIINLNLFLSVSLLRIHAEQSLDLATVLVTFMKAI